MNYSHVINLIRSFENIETLIHFMDFYQYESDQNRVELTDAEMNHLQQVCQEAKNRLELKHSGQIH